MTDAERPSSNGPMRRIRSFVMRPGRMTDGQKKAYAEHFPKWGLTLDDGMPDWDTEFGRSAPRVLEIGFGMGQSLLEMTAADPSRDFIGVEVHKPGVGRILAGIAEHELNNLRVYQDDAVEVLAQCIPDGSLDRIQIYFPDPWHKKKHHKRRLIQPGFVQQLRKKLAVGGMLHLATDWEHYAEQMLDVMSAAEGYRNQYEGYAPRPEYRPVTKFEKRGERLGHGVWDMLFARSE